MKSFYSNTLIILLTFFLTIPAHGKKVIVGYFLLEPHSGINKENHNGAVIEYWEKYIAPEMGIIIEFKGPLPLPRLLKETALGKVNIIPLIAKTKGREKIYDYPKTPFFRINSCVTFTKKNKTKKISDVHFLRGKTLGFFKSGFIHPKLRNEKINWSLTYRMDWLNVSLKLLKHGRIDGIYHADIYSQKHYIKTNNLKKDVNVLKIPDTDTPLFAVFSKKDKGFYLKKYEKILPRVMKRVSYDKILKKYMYQEK